MKKIVVLTATRAEYGLLKPVILKLLQQKDIETKVVATGSHLSPELGMTVNEIENDGIQVDRKIEILMSSDTAVGVSKAMGLAMISFSEYFESEKPDGLVVLGDRYELLAICAAAMNARIPIFHLYGGDTTEGAVDEAVRHAVTKMSYLHFTSTEQNRRRVIQMGEHPDRVFTAGSTGIENILNTNWLDRSAIEARVGQTIPDDYAVVTFHPVTLENCSAKQQAMELLSAMKACSEIFFIVTKANADAEGRTINEILTEGAKDADNIVVVDSLGLQCYLSAVKSAKFVMGNSSSGISEVPSFKIPTINIGDRQRGRAQCKSIINCVPAKDEIIRAIEKACSREFAEEIADVVNPYGDGNSSEMIVNTIAKAVLENQIDLMKSFYEIDF